MAEEDYFGGKTSYFGGAGEYAPEFSTNAAPPIDYSNINFGVPGQAGVSYMPADVAQPNVPRLRPGYEMSALPAYPTTGAPLSMLTSAGRGVTTAPTAPVEAGLPSGAPSAPAGQGPQDRNMLERAGDYLNKNPMLAKLLGGGLTAGLGSIMGARGQAAAGRLQGDLGKLGATQRQQGQALVAAAQRGELTAPQQQQLEAFRAQQAQALSSRGITGGTAAQQLDAQIENMRQQLLQQNLQTGLALLQVGDQYTQQAITAGYNADQTAQNTAGRFYSAALQTLGAMPTQQQTQPTRNP